MLNMELKMILIALLKTLDIHEIYIRFDQIKSLTAVSIWYLFLEKQFTYRSWWFQKALAIMKTPLLVFRQGGLNKGIQLNLSNIFSIIIFTELYLFN